LLRPRFFVFFPIPVLLEGKQCAFPLTLLLFNSQFFFSPPGFCGRFRAPLSTPLRYFHDSVWCFSSIDPVCFPPRNSSFLNFCFFHLFGFSLFLFLTTVNSLLTLNPQPCPLFFFFSSLDSCFLYSSALLDSLHTFSFPNPPYFLGVLFDGSSSSSVAFLENFPFYLCRAQAFGFFYLPPPVVPLFGVSFLFLCSESSLLSPDFK